MIELGARSQYQMVRWRHAYDVHSATLSLSVTESGSTMGLKESECGQMGVKMKAGTNGCSIEPPALKLYAVEPVLVDTMTL